MTEGNRRGPEEDGGGPARGGQNPLSRIDIPPQEPLATQVARRLLDYILSGELQPGDRLPSERQLTDALGVNRAVVREALRSLGFLGLLETRQSSGTYFRGVESELLFKLFEWGLVLGERRIMELIEARVQLEVVVAGLAAEKRTAGDLEVLRERLAAMRDSSEAGFPEADVAFHLAIAEAARNTALRDMLRSIRSMAQGWIARNIAASQTTSIAYTDHVPIFEAIEQRDRNRARDAMEAHMQGATSRLLGTVEPAVAARLQDDEGSSEL